MNAYVLIAGFLTLFTTIGHFTMGSRMYLKPMLNSDFEQIPKKVMHSVFHYVSVFLITSTIVFILYGYGIEGSHGNEMLIKFLALNYAGFAAWQIIIALFSGIPKSLTKLFQWTFFILIAIFAWVGVA